MPLYVKKPHVVSLLLLFSALVLAACGGAPAEEGTPSPKGKEDPNDAGLVTDPEEVNTSEETDEEDGEEEAEDAKEGTTADKAQVSDEADSDETTASFDFYYADDELVEITSEQQELTYSRIDELLTRMWDHLQSPQDAQSQALWSGFTLRSIGLEGGALTIDVSRGEEVSFGSTAEAYAIDTLIQTFGQVEGVETIQLLVDGEVAESLAGHVTIDEPFHIETELLPR